MDEVAGLTVLETIREQISEADQARAGEAGERPP
jgi:hypothetical protein